MSEKKSRRDYAMTDSNCERYSDSNAWPLSRIVLIERGAKVELRYPPFDIILSRQR